MVTNPFKNLSLILLLCVFLSLNTVGDTKYTILSSPVSLAFDQFNVIKQIRIRFMPETCFHKSDIMMVSFSSPIQTVPSAIGYSLIDEFKKQLFTGSFNFIPDATITTLSLQYFKKGTSSSYTTDLSASTWYTTSQEVNRQWLTLVMKIPQALTNVFATRLGSLSMAIVSSLDAQHVRYQWTNAMSYFYFASLAATAPPQTITAQIANGIYGISGQLTSQLPGAVYPVYLQLTPTIDYFDFVLNIEFTSMTLVQLNALTMVPQTANFEFQGTCYFICQSIVSCITAQYCTVTKDKIQVKIAQMKTGTKYVLRFSVLNPPYQAQKNLLLWVDNNGTSQDTANIVTQLSTQQITISTDELKLFWKIPYTTVISSMGLGFFVDGGINTVEVGFLIDKSSPFGQVLQVSVYVGSAQLILGSIDHNLPSVNTTISYEYVFPYLKIKNVTALTRTSYRYWVGFRVRYVSADLLDPIGSVSIKLNKYPTQTLFNALVVNNPKSKIVYSDFHDPAGFHSAGFKNYDTQVISSGDNSLQNGTSQAMRKYFNQPTTVGVDPSIPNQQLLFLLNVPQAKIYLGTLGQKYDTKIFLNPNIFQSISNQGIQLVAYNTLTSKWDNFGNDCYKDQSLTPTIQQFMCQKYRDHVFDQQFDNVLNVQPFFSYYQHTCGNGIKVKCLDAVSCKEECTLFKGYSLVKGKAGIAAIRNVTFVANYQSPMQAGDQNLDFIVCFYHNGAFVSATLINAYTVKSQPLKQTSVSFINSYHDGTSYNLGDKIPTLIKISGKLQISQYLNLQSPQKMKVYFPNTKVAFNSFVTNNNQLGCSYYCRYNQSMSAAVTENWLEWHSVSVENIPAMTNDFKILLPIQLTAGLMSVYVAFEARGKTVGVYRFAGSAVSESISMPLTSLFLPQTYTTLWNQVSDWVISPANTYLQKMNLQQTNSYDSSTLITMSNSIMPYHDNPYVTVSIQNMQILAPYTTIIVGNSLRNRTCDKLTYFYNSKKIQAFICQLYTNDNTTSNNIKIEYPLYNNNLGPGYPYDQVINYGYASDSVTGQLQGIKRQSGDKVLINSCKTNKATQYNVGEIGRQLEIYKIQIDPILLSASTYTKLQLVIQIPNNIQPAECSVIEVIFWSKISCTVLTQVGNITTLQLSISNSDTVKLLQFYVYLNCYQTGGVSLAPGQLYKLKVKYPHTTGGLESIYGSAFTPFTSTICQCDNSFTYINAAYNDTILITSHRLNSIGINLNTELQFTIILSKQKSHLLKNSYLQLQFTNLQVTQQTFCYLTTFEHRFWKRSWTSTTYRLFTNADVQGFTANAIVVKCSNLVMRGLIPTLIVRVFDVTANVVIMTSTVGTPYVLVTAPYFGSSTISVGSGTISAKQYTTLGFNSFQTINYVVSGTGLVQGFIDLSQYAIDSRILRCKLSIAQDVICRFYDINTNSSLESRSRFIYFKTLYTAAFTFITLSIYPILQEKMVTAPKLNTLIINNGVAFYVPITDLLPTVVVNDVFLVSSYNVMPTVNLTTTTTTTTAKFSFEVTYSFPITISQPLYIQIDEIFFFNSIDLVTMKCTINNLTIVPCQLVQKDLVKLNSYTHTTGISYTLRIQSFQVNQQIPLYDRQNFFFRMFVIDPSTKQIDYVSYLNMDLVQASQIMTIIRYYQSLSGVSSLIWNLTDSVTGLQTLPKIYVGYYGSPISMMVYDSSNFQEDFLLSSSNYSLGNFQCYMGYPQCQLQIVADNFTSVFKSIYFTHLSTVYNQPPLLQVQVSNQKCVITAEFTNYKIYQNGITLPIVLNFTKCKPRSLITIIPTLNSTEVIIQSSLSQLQVTYDNPIGLIIVKHTSSITTLKNYLLSLTLTGTYASSFTIPSSFVIEKILRTETNIMAKAPQTVSLTSDQVKVRIQCNQPSTVYWTVGFYPTTLGVKGQDIQTRLLNGQVGLWTSIQDYYTFGNLEYGLTYTEVPNVWKQLWIDQLWGNTMYSFKYFCVNIKGTFSDGKILTFTTPQSIYSMVKLQLGFSTPLNYSTVNNFACAISQSLIIPYKQTVSSVNSNCKNASLIFFNSETDILWNEKTGSTGNEVFYYNFYIKSFTLSALNITSTIRDLLRKNYRIMKSQIPLWNGFNMQNISLNQYSQRIDPNVITPQINGQPSIQLDQTAIQIALPVANQLSYVVMGLLSSYFNSTTMSLPQTYMIKQGKFSQNVDFDKVSMNYTTGNITFILDGLIADTQYSIFYFVTVDDPSINAKHSTVNYVNLVTSPYLQVDLFDGIMLRNGLLWVIVLLVALFIVG